MTYCLQSAIPLLIEPFNSRDDSGALTMIQKQLSVFKILRALKVVCLKLKDTLFGLEVAPLCVFVCVCVCVCRRWLDHLG